jgi:hypothetical protein
MFPEELLNHPSADFFIYHKKGGREEEREERRKAGRQRVVCWQFLA